MWSSHLLIALSGLSLLASAYPTDNASHLEVAREYDFIIVGGKQRWAWHQTAVNLTYYCRWNNRPCTGRSIESIWNSQGARFGSGPKTGYCSYVQSAWCCRISRR